MKSESEFIKELEQRAKEQGKLVKTELIPAWARGLGDWLAINPWRLLVPLAAIVYLVSRILVGTNLVEMTLEIFGGFR